MADNAILIVIQQTTQLASCREVIGVALIAKKVRWYLNPPCRMG